MKKRLLSVVLVLSASVMVITGCSNTTIDVKVNTDTQAEADKVSDEASDEESDSQKSLESSMIEVTLEGGSGKATVESPTAIRVEDGKYIATITWSSPYYDYMIVDGEKYEPVNTEGNSVFEIPVDGLDEKLEVIADTVAMSKPHEIEYTLYFDSKSMK